MIKVVSNYDIDSDGLALDTCVMVAVPKTLEEVGDTIIESELLSLLHQVYTKKPDLVLDVIGKLCEEVANDKTDIDND